MNGLFGGLTGVDAVAAKSTIMMPFF